MDYTTIEQIVNDFQYLYMSNIVDSGHNASGKLATEQKHLLKWDGRYFTVVLQLEEYYKFLENGTKPHFPPVDKLLEWIRVKPVLPREINGKLPTNNQLAFLIGRKISRVGTEPTHLLSNTLKEFDLVGKVYKEFVRLWKEEQLKELTQDGK